MRIVRSDFFQERHRNWDSRGHWGLGNHIVPDFFRSGDYWVVRSDEVKIQGRYGRDGGYALHGLAFGGPFLQNHRLAIDRLWDGTFLMHFDGRQIRSSSFSNNLVQVRVQTEGRRRRKFRSATVTLPQGVSVDLSRCTWNNGNSASVTAHITMRKQAEGQDGHCGRADGELADDTRDHVLRRWGGQVPLGERLFHEAPPSLLGAGEEPADGPSAAEVCANSPPFPEDVETCKAALNGSNPVLADALLPGCVIDVCVGGAGAVEAAAGAAETLTERLSAAGPPPAPNADGWYDGGPRKSCDEGCGERGLVCSEEQLRAHNGDVDSPEKVRALIGDVGGNTFAQVCDQTWGSADDVPNWWLGGCHGSVASRSLSTFSCSARPRGTALPKHRLCYCHAP